MNGNKDVWTDKHQSKCLYSLFSGDEIIGDLKVFSVPACLNYLVLFFLGGDNAHELLAQ